MSRDEVLAWLDDDGVEMAIVAGPEHDSWIAQLMHGSWAPLPRGVAHPVGDLVRRCCLHPGVAMLGDWQGDPADEALAVEIFDFAASLRALAWEVRRLIRPNGVLFTWAVDSRVWARVCHIGPWPNRAAFCGRAERVGTLKAAQEFMVRQGLATYHPPFRRGRYGSTGGDRWMSRSPTAPVRPQVYVERRPRRSRL